MLALQSCFSSSTTKGGTSGNGGYNLSALLIRLFKKCSYKSYFPHLKTLSIVRLATSQISGSIHATYSLPRGNTLHFFLISSKTSRFSNAPISHCLMSPPVCKFNDQNIFMPSNVNVYLYPVIVSVYFLATSSHCLSTCGSASITVVSFSPFLNNLSLRSYKSFFYPCVIS